MKELDAQLLSLLREYLTIGEPIPTLSLGKPNWVARVDERGVSIETERTRAAGKPAQLVPAWMIEVAWGRLNRSGSLTNKELLHELNVKRSSAVCAILAQLPGVAVTSSRPVVLKRAEG